LIRTILEKVQLFPKEESHLGEEAIFILLRPFGRYMSRGKVIDDVYILGFHKNS